MSNTYTNGTQRIVYVKWEGEYLPIGCLTGNDFNEGVDMLETVTDDNEGWTTETPTNQFYSFSVNGLIINTAYSGGDTTKVSYDRLKTLKRSRTLVEWKIEDENLIFSDTGSAYITSLSDSVNIDEFITFSASFDGYGEPIAGTAKVYKLQDGYENIIQDGNDNEIITQ